MSKSKSNDIKIELVVVGSGDPSVGIFQSQEHVTVILHDQGDDFPTQEMVDGLKEYFSEAMENCRTKVLTKAEFDASCASEVAWEQKYLEPK